MNSIFKLFDEQPLIPLGLVAFLVVLAIMQRRQRKADTTGYPVTAASANADIGMPVARSQQPRGPLDVPLFHWTPRDPFRIRDLLNGGALTLGRAGAGKTSSSGRMLMQSIVNNRQSGGLILAAKPEDVGDVARIFKKAGRLRDLIVFDQHSGMRCNFLGCLKRPRDVVTFLTTMSEVMKRRDSKGGGDNNRFYDAQEERCNYSAVAALQTAGEPLTAPNIHQFIMTAATTPEELQSPEWQRKYHSKVLERGFNAHKNPLDAHDFQLCTDFWIKEWAGMMDAKTRGNILAGVQGTLHVMNSGIVREMCSGETNCSPADVLNGKWLLINFPPSTWGAAGHLISAGWKQLVEMAILERKADNDSPFCVIWCDEAHQFVTGGPNGDNYFIAQSRSHKGCLVYLTQSVSSFYAAMNGEAGKHQADSLLANFATVIAHPCDPVSAKWLGSKLGRCEKIFYGGNSSPNHNQFIWDQLNGQQNSSASFNTHMEPTLEDNEFMVGRTGGPDNGFVCDAVVIRSGERFSDGKSYQRVAFNQRG